MGAPLQNLIFLTVIFVLLTVLTNCAPPQQKRQFPYVKSLSADDDEIYRMDLISWVHGHTVQVGNISEADIKAIVNSLRLLIRPEFAKYPRVKVYNYEFRNGASENSEAGSWPVTREVLVYSDPEENKQWILNIEDLDLRQNLIIFRLGDLGFGFAKKDTYVVLRKSMGNKDPFHYFHLAYIMPRGKGNRDKGKSGNGKGYDVEWDNIRPRDMLPIPLIYKEPEDIHRDHCKPRDCGLPEVIFGTCPPVRLSCDDLKGVQIYGREKERMDALIREQQPFIYELARTVSINQKYLKGEEANSRLKRSPVPANNNHPIPKPKRSEPAPSSGIALPEDSHHHSVKKDIADAANNNKNPTIVVIQKDDLNAAPGKGNTEEAPANQVATDPEGLLARSVREGNVKPTEAPSAAQTAATPTGKPNGSSQNSESSYFETILEKIRTSPPAKYTVRSKECIGCEPMGTFFSEYEENALTSYVVNNLINDIFKNTSSAVFSPEGQEILHEYEKILPYVGYGPCPYSIYAISQSPKSLELDDIIEYYAETLAVNCQDRSCEWQLWKSKMREMLTSKHHFLEIWPDKTVHLNKSSLLPRSQILSTYEFQQFMVSILFSTYTTEFHLQMLSRTDEDMKQMSHENQSIRMRFQTKLLLRAMDELIKSYPQHLIKGTRYLLQILEDKYLALVVEHGAINRFNFKGGEAERNLFKMTNKNDRVQTLALKDFLMNGIASVTKSGAGVLSAFTTFYNHNRERISNLLVEFGVDRQRKNKVNQRRSAEDYETELLKKVWAEGDLYGDRREQRFVSAVLVDDSDDMDG